MGGRSETGSVKHRFFAESLDDEAVNLEGGEAHHAANVLRLGVGAAVELFDGSGGLAEGVIVSIERSKVSVAVRRREVQMERSGPIVHLAFAVPKGKRLAWLLEKATELGAASLRPVIFERSVAGAENPKKSQLDRWRSHCIAPAKQSGLNFLPEIFSPRNLKNFLSDSPDATVRVFGDTTDAAAGVAQALGEVSSAAQGQDQADLSPNANRQFSVLVGPEGGFTTPERELLLDGRFRPVRIGSTILRIETAAIAILGVIMAINGPD
ncbi:MAG: RsmE family RNA methyltransferase [Planctomycetota bacterium]|jgi:16S rRNA (uracil1498-N3)-methyltransferase